MLFNSWQFLIFFIIVFALYVRLQHREQNLLLLAASYFFYGSWDVRFLGLLGFTTLVDYFCALEIHRAERQRKRKIYLALSVGCNLAVLGFFKYFNFFIGSIEALSGIHFDVWKILLPVGVSFYTFQSISYTVDVYRRDIAPLKKLTDYALFVSFFPQLVAGPIERATQLLPQVLAPRQVNRQQIEEGLYRAALGFVKKIFIADNLAPIVNELFSKQGGLSGWETLLAVYAFSFQIYADFSGYTDIARGVARMMGFHLRLNFDLPYFSRSPREFWRRWHISLSTWLRDYLYIPLGGSRGGEVKTCFNLLITMALGGLWHGASWTFVVWGIYHGILLIAQRIWNKFNPERKNELGRVDARPMALLQMAGMFHLTALGWLFFRAESLPQVWSMVGSFASNWSMSWTAYYYAKEIILLTGFWFVGEAFEYFQNDRRVWQKAHGLVKAAALGLWAAWMLVIYAMGMAHGNEFIYFQF